MKITAVICEYNPFHFGHEYHISEIKKNSDAVIAVMSGSFTQRGEPAVISKYLRARAAICSGADLVLELPFPFSAASAEYFARGGIDIAEKCGVVSEISFGSESGDINALRRAAENTYSPEFLRELEKAAKASGGKHFGRMYFSVYRSLYGENDIFDGSNNILAVAYLRELIRRKSAVSAHTVKRTGTAYNDKSGDGFLSATAIREKIFAGEMPSLPAESENLLCDCIRNGEIARYENLFRPFAAFLRTANAADIAKFHEMNDEIASRLICAAQRSADMASLTEAAKTKAYSASRIKRALLFSFLGIKETDFSPAEYTYLLAANEKGRAILSDINKNGKLFVLTKPADYKESAFAEKYEKSLRAEALWTLALDKPAPADILLKSKPYIK